MSKPQFKASVKPEMLKRGLQIDESLQISFWFNISDPDLNQQLEAYYKANQADWRSRPSIELQVKTPSGFEKITSSGLFLNDGTSVQTSAPSELPVSPPPPPPPPLQGQPAPPVAPPPPPLRPSVDDGNDL